MKILVINAGSSSLKYQLIDTDNEAVLAKGNCERIGQNGAFIGFKTPDGKKINRKTQMLNHTQAFEAVKNALIDPRIRCNQRFVRGFRRRSQSCAGRCVL